MILYQDTLENIQPQNLRGFFVGWAAPLSPDQHLDVLRNSTHFILAVDYTTGHVVGFITALSDNVLSAYIPLVEVLPEYQSQGIGKELVQRMLWKLRELYMVDLMCDVPLQDYYEKFGMRRAHGMMIRRHNLHSSKLPGDEF